jgi:two-component system NtrC family sensor kinase
MFSRPSKEETKEVEINEIIEFVLKLIEHQYSLEDIKVARDLGEGLPKVKVDEKQIHEVFMNLCRNSADAMIPGGGGTLTIRTSKENGFVKVEVEDTGSGISEENLQKIFDPFFTTKEHGTGLGLSVCYGIIQSHGGELKYTSEVGKGTTATILLPAAGGGREIV